MSIETMKLALDWIEGNGKYEDGDSIATALRQAIEQAEQKSETYVTHDELADYMDKIADAIAYKSHEQLNHLASILRENT